LKLVWSCPIVVHNDLRILNPSDTHNWYYYVFSVYHSPYNHDCKDYGILKIHSSNNCCVYLTD
jgi:hypothetical protein